MLGIGLSPRNCRHTEQLAETIGHRHIRCPTLRMFP